MTGERWLASSPADQLRRTCPRAPRRRGAANRPRGAGPGCPGRGRRRDSQLALPPRGIGPRCVVVLRASVPEATVHQDSDAGAAQDDVSPTPAAGALGRRVDQEAQAPPVELPPELQLGRGVPATGPRQHPSSRLARRWRGRRQGQRLVRGTSLAVTQHLRPPVRSEGMVTPRYDISGRSRCPGSATPGRGAQRGWRALGDHGPPPGRPRRLLAITGTAEGPTLGIGPSVVHTSRRAMLSCSRWCSRSSRTRSRTRPAASSRRRSCTAARRPPSPAAPRSARWSCAPRPGPP